MAEGIKDLFYTDVSFSYRTMGVVLYKSFNTFRKSYNSYYDLNKEVAPPSFGYGWSCDLSTTVKNSNIEFCFGDVYSHTYGELSSGNKRHFLLRMNFIDIGAGTGFTAENWKIFFMGSLIFTKQVIKSYYEFKDGTIDLGLAHKLNGYYDAYTGIKTTLGIKGHCHISRWAGLNMRLQWICTNGSIGELNDKNPAKFSQNRMNSLPVDVETFFDNGGTGGGYDGTYIEADMGGLMLSFGLTIFITKEEL